MELKQTTNEAPEQPEAAEKKARKPETAQLNVRIDADVVEYAKSEAERLDISQAEFVATLVKDYKSDRIAEIHPNFASDKDAFDSHLRQVTELYTGIISKYNTLREDIEKEVKEELDSRKAEIEKLKMDGKDLKIRAEKAEAEAKETVALRETIEALEKTIVDKDTIIAANANLTARLDEALIKADAADQAEKELQTRLVEAERSLGIANGKIELMKEQEEKDAADAAQRIAEAKADADKRLEETKAEFEIRIEAIKADGEAALKKAESDADRRVAETKSDAIERIAKVESDMADRIAKLEAELTAKDVKITELYEKMTK